VRSAGAPLFAGGENPADPISPAAQRRADDTGLMTTADRDALASPATARVTALFGPTAVGKTELAVALSRRLRAQGEHPVAVSADALQVYRGLETLTGAVAAVDRGELEHRLLAFVPITEAFSVARYARLAHAEIDSLLAAGRTPLVVGGTGLYLRAALADLALRPAPSRGLRERRVAELERDGVQALHAELARRAPTVAARVDPRDRSRVVRALELADMGALGEPPARSELWTDRTRHPTRLIGLVMEREALYARIDARVEAMLAAGALEEVRAADAAGASATARKALGFAELLSGDVEAMKRRTRQYAKRQLTWMRKLAGVQLVDVTGRPADEVAASLDMIGTGAGSPARVVAASVARDGRSARPHTGSANREQGDA
jgi:tRNA dimethylallyltransferase